MADGARPPPLVGRSRRVADSCRSIAASITNGDASTPSGSRYVLVGEGARAPLAVPIVNLRTMEEDGLEEREVWARIAPPRMGPTRQTQPVRTPCAWVPPQPKLGASTTAKDLVKGKPGTDEATADERSGRRGS